MILPWYILGAALQQTPLPAIEGLTWHEVELTSTLDGVKQPIIVGVPAGYQAGKPMPLLVALHTWSAEYRQQAGDYGPLAAERGWLLVLPHFRGPNLDTSPRATQAGGSIPAQHDIIDAVEYMKATYSVDADRVYLSGGSGGGHMALLMAGKYPEVWAAVCAWCPITDLREWHAQQNDYAKHIEAVCGGKPGASPEVDFEYLRRSPRTFITNAAATPIMLGHGDRDPVIDPAQSWRTFQALRSVPEHHTLFRSWCAGHSGLVTEGLDWASNQRRAKTPPREMHLVTDEARWYFWLFLEPAERLKLGRAVAKVGDQVIEITTDAVSRLAVNLRLLGRAEPTAVLCDGQACPEARYDPATGILTVPLAGGQARAIVVR